jgi:hypothetical protein
MHIKTHATTTMASAAAAATTTTSVSPSQLVLFLAPKGVAVCRHFYKIIVSALNKIYIASYITQPNCHLGFTISLQIVQ